MSGLIECDFVQTSEKREKHRDVVDFMDSSRGHDSVINFAPVAASMANKTGFIDPTGVKAGEYVSRIISWYTKGVSCKPFCWLATHPR